MREVMMGVAGTLFVVLFGLCGSACASGDTHSLYYLYTIQSKSFSEGGYEFSAETLLDDEEIDSYSSISTNTGGIRTPKQEWLRKMKEREWIEGTDKLKYDGQELNQVLESHMKAFRHRESDGHTLQWMAGCEGEVHSDGSVSGSNGVNEYTYDGQTLISYDGTLKKRSASVRRVKKTVEEWNGGHGPNAGLNYRECVYWLEVYLQYTTAEAKQFQNGKCVHCQNGPRGRFIVGVAGGVMVALLALLFGVIYVTGKKDNDPQTINDIQEGTI